jgi:ATP-binding cassette, subfamily B, bacterial
MVELEEVGWPIAQTVEALEAAAHHCGLPLDERADIAPIWGADSLGVASFDRWVEASAGWLGLEAEPIDVEYPEVESLLFRSAPSLIRVPGKDTLLVVIGHRGSNVLLLNREFEQRRVPVPELRALMCRDVEAPVDRKIDEWLTEIVEEPDRRSKARNLLLRDLLEKTHVARCYLVRIPAGASFWAQLRFEGVAAQMATLVLAHAAQFLLGLAAWYTLASGAFGGGIDGDWLVAWALLLVTSIPVQIFTFWTQGKVVLGVGALLKRRLLSGTLRIEQDALRREGAGQLIGRTLDASTVEALALSGGLFAVLACIELLIMAAILGAGPGGAVQAFAFLGWAAITLAIAWQSIGKTQRWTHARRDITSDLVEQMVGHRTRLAQQEPAHWHDDEDEALHRYFALSASMDRKEAYVHSMPQAWYVIGLGAMLPSILQSSSSSAGLTVAIGGMLLGGGALSRLSSGLTQVGEAITAWGEVKPLYEAAARPELQPSPVFVASHLVGTSMPQSGTPVSGIPILDATDLVFSYPGRSQPVLREGTMKIWHGDRILLEGRSGGGKSTFASLLAGLRRPDSGLLLLQGLDWQTVGPEGWRRSVATAPQFHESHVLSDTFLFNLLMGRRWPPSAADVEEAATVCHALGLGDLLARMPAGLMQMVGETGWRLSHGECSRLFIARTLLQDGKVIVLDESFAALDPHTAEECLRCVLARAPSLVVIAHP